MNATKSQSVFMRLMHGGYVEDSPRGKIVVESDREQARAYLDATINSQDFTWDMMEAIQKEFDEAGATCFEELPRHFQRFAKSRKLDRQLREKFNLKANGQPYDKADLNQFWEERLSSFIRRVQVECLLTEAHAKYLDREYCLAEGIIRQTMEDFYLDPEDSYYRWGPMLFMLAKDETRDKLRNKVHGLYMLYRGAMYASGEWHAMTGYLSVAPSFKHDPRYAESPAPAKRHLKAA